MVKSMTGYGRAREMRSGRDITVEVRSVNNRYLDCTVKLPRAYIFRRGRHQGTRTESDLTRQGGRVRHHRHLGGGCGGGAGERRRWRRGTMTR